MQEQGMRRGSSNRSGSFGALIRTAKERAAPKFDAERGAKLIVSALDKVDRGKTALSCKAEKGAQLFGRMRAKAHTAAQAAAAAAAEVKGGASPASSSGALATVADADPRVKKICALGFTPVAARLALAHCGSSVGTNEACKWLMDEANSEDIVAAEAGEVWAAEHLVPKQQARRPARAAAAEAGGAGVLSPGQRCSPEAFLDGEDVCLFSSAASPAAPLKAPQSPTPSSPGVGCASPPGCTEQQPESCCSEQQPAEADAADDAAAGQSDGEERAQEEPLEGEGPSEGEEEELVVAPPPDGGSWEWPLSRHEKSVRLQTLERSMAELDRKVLMEALVRERVAAREAGRVPAPRRRASHAAHHHK